MREASVSGYKLLPAPQAWGGGSGGAADGGAMAQTSRPLHHRLRRRSPSPSLRDREDRNSQSPETTDGGRRHEPVRPSIMTYTHAFESFAASLIGLPISHVWRGHGSAIFVECGKLEPVTRRDGSTGNPQGEVSLGIEWSWRIEDRTAIRCGSWSEEELWEPALTLLRDARIERCELFGTLPEVAITTDGEIRLLSFSTTDGQPQWHFVDRRNGPPRWFTVREGRLHLGDGSERTF